MSSLPQAPSANVAYKRHPVQVGEQQSFRSAERCLCLKWMLLPLPSALLQGLMFGYATDETEECMPLTIILAHKLNARMADLRRSGVLPWLRPDSKTQVSLFLCPPVSGSSRHTL